MKKSTFAVLALTAQLVVVIGFLIRKDLLKPENAYLIGNSYNVIYQPINTDQKGFCDIMNRFEFSTHFANDSIFLLESTRGIEKYAWSIQGDSINFGGATYLLTNNKDVFFMLTKDYMIQLLPL